MKKELQRFEEGPETIILLESLTATLKNYGIGKYQAMTAYMDSGLENSHLSIAEYTLD